LKGTAGPCKEIRESRTRREKKQKKRRKREIKRTPSGKKNTKFLPENLHGILRRGEGLSTSLNKRRKRGLEYESSKGKGNYWTSSSHPVPPNAKEGFPDTAGKDIEKGVKKWEKRRY